MHNSFFSSMRTLARHKMPQADRFKEMRWCWSSFVCENSHVGYRIVTATHQLTRGIQSSFPLASRCNASKRLIIVEEKQAFRAAPIQPIYFVSSLI